MGILLMILGGVAALASLAAHIFILVAAFQDETWKGILCLVCGLYMLYWALLEFYHEHKWVIVGVWLASGYLADHLFTVGGEMMEAPTPETTQPQPAPGAGA